MEAYGHLLVPRSASGKVDRRLPAVICQHGFGGVPKFVSGVGTNVETNDHFYHRFGERLAERGYVVFAPYVCVPAESLPPGESHRADLVNPLVREAAALGLMRTSIELTKLHRIVDFLQSLPFVDGNRIGYYGLSYGGYSAIWMPPLEPRLRFSIVSGHFNYQRSKLLQPGGSGHLWGLPDEDFYNWNLLNRITHVELVAAMWPRPVCIEWGLSDGTTTPAWHQEAADDLAKRYVIPWKMVDKVVFDDYLGPHTIHGVNTFAFVDRCLRPERSAERDYSCDGEHYCYAQVAPDFHGYAPSSESPFTTKLVDSTKESVIRGRFYVSSVSPTLQGLGLKVARVGHPGDLLVQLGSRQGGSDLGDLRLQASDVTPEYGLWYDLKLPHPERLDPRELYWFEVRSASGQAPQDGYQVYGPKPLGGEDYPHSFGLSFRTLTQNANWDKSSH